MNNVLDISPDDKRMSMFLKAALPKFVPLISPLASRFARPVLSEDQMLESIRDGLSSLNVMLGIDSEDVIKPRIATQSIDGRPDPSVLNVCMFCNYEGLPFNTMLVFAFDTEATFLWYEIKSVDVYLVDPMDPKNWVFICSCGLPVMETISDIHH